MIIHIRSTQGTTTICGLPSSDHVALRSQTVDSLALPTQVCPECEDKQALYDLGNTELGGDEGTQCLRCAWPPPGQPCMCDA